jgi:pimeloyl-ACP methyl ester carboxylesterase
MTLPHFNLGDDGAPLHFLHANGYPPECYKPLFELLQPRFHVFGMKLRALWPDAKPEDVTDWNPFTNDLLQFLDEQKTGPVLAVGHSVGGIATLRAALREPNRFRGLVLVDPVLFPPYFIVFWNILRALGLGYRTHPLIAGALKRRRQFDDLDVVFRAYRRREVFRNFSDESLRAYVDGIVRPREGGGYELAFSPEWEARIYYTGVAKDLELWRNLKNLRIPTLIIRGAQSDAFWEGSAARVRRANPNVQIETIQNAGHLVPLERPREVAELILSFSKNVERDGIPLSRR